MVDLLGFFLNLNFVGNVWIYGSDDFLAYYFKKVKIGCTPLCYLFSFFSITTVWVLITILLLISCIWTFAVKNCTNYHTSHVQLISG
jgi:hypothetical protein